jgi:hypothetical protein
MDQEAPRSPGNSPAVRVLIPVAPSSGRQSAQGPPEGRKTARAIALLQCKNGTTRAEIRNQMGWQKHTVGGFMAERSHWDNQ